MHKMIVKGLSNAQLLEGALKQHDRHFCVVANKGSSAKVNLLLDRAIKAFVTLRYR
jgi:hypothetical protein